MKLGTSMLTVDLGNEFINKFDSWKKKVIIEGMKHRLKKLIEKDLKELEDKK